MSTDLLPCPFCGVDPVSRRSAGDTWEITCDEGECGWACVYAFTEEDAIAQWQTRRFPATPAPESPAPARTDLDWDLINRVSKAPAQSFMAPEVGTGSETSPEPAAQFWKDLENLLDFLGHKRGEVLELCVNPGRLEEVLDSIATVCGAHLEAKPAKASDAEQIPHPVAEAEQSPQPAGGLVEAAENLAWAAEVEIQGGHRTRAFIQQHRSKVTFWIKSVRAALAQAPTRNAGEGE